VNWLIYLKFALNHFCKKWAPKNIKRLLWAIEPEKIYTRKIDKIWVNELEIYGPNYINVPEIYGPKIDKSGKMSQI